MDFRLDLPATRWRGSRYVAQPLKVPTIGLSCCFRSQTNPFADSAQVGHVPQVTVPLGILTALVLGFLVAVGQSALTMPFVASSTRRDQFVKVITWPEGECGCAHGKIRNQVTDCSGSMRRALGARAAWHLLCVGSGDLVVVSQNRTPRTYAIIILGASRARKFRSHLFLVRGPASLILTMAPTTRH